MRIISSPPALSHTSSTLMEEVIAGIAFAVLFFCIIFGFCVLGGGYA